MKNLQISKIFSIFFIFQTISYIKTSENPIKIIETEIQLSEENFDSKKDDQTVIYISDSGKLIIKNSIINKSGNLTNITEQLSNSAIISYGYLIADNLNINIDANFSYALYSCDSFSYNIIKNSKFISTRKDKIKNIGIEISNSYLEISNSLLDNFFNFGLDSSTSNVSIKNCEIINSPIYSQNDLYFSIENSKIIFNNTDYYNLFGFEVVLTDNFILRNVTVMNDHLYTVFYLIQISNSTIIDNVKIYTNNKDKYASGFDIYSSFIEIKNSLLLGLDFGIELHGYDDYQIDIDNLEIKETGVCLYTYFYMFREKRHAFINIKNSIMNCQIVFDSYNYMQTYIENTTTNLFEKKNESLPFYYYIEASYDSSTTCNYCKLYNNLSDDYVFFDVYNNSEIIFKNSYIQNRDSINNFFAKVTNDSILQIDNSNIEITGKNGNNDGILIEYYGKVEINNSKINISINNNKQFIYVNESSADIIIENLTINDISQFLYLNGNSMNKKNKDITNLYIISSNINGNIFGQNYWNLFIKLSKNSNFTGNINNDDKIKNVIMHVEKGSKFIQNGDSIIHDYYDENDYIESKTVTFASLIVLLMFFVITTIALSGILIYIRFNGYYKSKKYDDEDIDVKIDGNLIDDDSKN